MLNRSQIYLVLIGLCFLVYANALNNSFLDVDDYASILENPRILQSSWLDPPGLLNSLIYLIAGYNPVAYHLANILLHSLNTILVFSFLKLCFPAESSFLAACVFAVHPIHTEAVTWVSGRPYLLLASFILVTCLLYYRAMNASLADKKINLKLYLFSISIFSYYIIRNYSFFFLLPLLLILCDTVLKKWQDNWKWWLPFFAIVAARLILAQDLVLKRIANLRVELGEPITKNPILYFIYSFSGHLKLLIWPAQLTLYHEPAIISPNLNNYGTLYFVLIILLLFFTFKKAGEVFWGLGIFILFLAPTYSPLPIASLVAERYLYFPSIALSIFAAYLYERYKGFKKYTVTLLVFVIVSYGARTIARNEDWKNPSRFWRKTILTSPYSARAHNSLGVVYAKEANIDRAIAEYQRAIEINPRYKRAYNNLANLYNNLGKHKEAIALYELAIKQDGLFTQAYNNLAELYIRTAKFKEAVVLLKKAIEIDPHYVDAYNNLGLAYNALGDREEAIASLKQALFINPKYLKAYNNLAVAYYEAQDKEKAIGLWEKAIAIEPYDALTHFNLSVAYFKEEKYSLAIKYCDEAIRLGYRVPAELLESLQPYRKK